MTRQGLEAGPNQIKGQGGHEAGGRKTDKEGGHMTDAAKAESRRTQGGQWRTHGGQAPGTRPEYIAAKLKDVLLHPGIAVGMLLLLPPRTKHTRTPTNNMRVQGMEL